MAEDRLARVMREDVMRSLAEAKLQLAQADFDILELQVLHDCLPMPWCTTHHCRISLSLQCFEPVALTTSGDVDTGIAGFEMPVTI